MTILYIEDEAGPGKSTTLLLESEGYEVDWIQPKSSQYFQQIKAHLDAHEGKYDAIIHDLQLNSNDPQSSKDLSLCDMISNVKKYQSPKLCWIIISGTPSKIPLLEKYPLINLFIEKKDPDLDEKLLGELEKHIS